MRARSCPGTIGQLRHAIVLVPRESCISISFSSGPLVEDSRGALPVRRSRFQDRAVDGAVRPVLKHGPRSLTWVRVVGWQTPRRREIDWMITLSVPHRLWLILWMKNTRLSMYVGTRKMVNYAWSGWSQGKPWWRTVEILTCKSFFRIEYRGERLIEPSSSWFPPKFPSG